MKYIYFKGHLQGLNPSGSFIGAQDRPVEVFWDGYSRRVPDWIQFYANHNNCSNMATPTSSWTNHRHQ